MLIFQRIAGKIQQNSGQELNDNFDVLKRSLAALELSCVLSSEERKIARESLVVKWGVIDEPHAKMRMASILCALPGL